MKELYEAMVKEAYEDFIKRHPHSNMSWKDIKDRTNFDDLTDVKITINILKSRYGN